MYVEYNPNPASLKIVGDCAIRALAKALNVDWEKAYLMLCSNGFAMGDLPNSNVVIASVLRQNGFKRVDMVNGCPECISVKEFAEGHPKGTYVLGTGSHLVTVVDGNYYDAWDSGDEIPAYAWRKEK